MSIEARSYWLSCKLTEEEREKLFLLAHEKGSTVSETLSGIVRAYLASGEDTEAEDV